MKNNCKAIAPIRRAARSGYTALLLLGCLQSLLLGIAWIASDYYPLCVGRASLEFRRVWLTVGYQIALDAGQLEISAQARQLWENADPSLDHFLAEGNGPLTGFYFSRLSPSAVRNHCEETGSIWNAIGIYQTSDEALATNGPTGIVLSFRLVMSLSIVIAATSGRVLFRKHLTARRARAGKCPMCGYDLRASGPVCPECGSNMERSRAL